MDRQIRSRFIERTNVPGRNLAGHGIRAHVADAPPEFQTRSGEDRSGVGTEKAFLIFHRPKACALIAANDPPSAVPKVLRHKVQQRSKTFWVSAPHERTCRSVLFSLEEAASIQAIGTNTKSAQLLKSWLLSVYASPIDFNTKSAMRFISSRVAPFTACTVRPAITVAMKRARSAGPMPLGNSPAL